MTAVDVAHELSLTLTWRHGTGGLTAFFGALQQGRILGGRCPVCARIVVPPRARCPVDGSALQVCDLPPTGIVMQITTGAASNLPGTGPLPQTFALVQITGSDNALLARIDATNGNPRPGDIVSLAHQGSSASHPVQHLVFIRAAVMDSGSAS